MGQKPHICVCICTYKRPKSAETIVVKLETRKRRASLTDSIVIVDNDRSGICTSKPRNPCRQSKISINYYVEPEQNIALARNKASREYQG